MQQLPAFFAALSLGFVCAVAQGQTAEIPSAPSAPLPSAPASAAKPVFALPAATYERPVGPAPARAKSSEEACPGDVQKAPHKQGISAEIQGPVRNYLQLVMSQIDDHWVHNMPTSVRRDGWAPGKMLAIYFLIHDDGSYTPPLVTSSSGKALYDRLALDAIRSHDTFPPPPQGLKEPLEVCIRFAYNPGPRGVGEPNYDNWQKPDPAAKP